MVRAYIDYTRVELAGRLQEIDAELATLRIQKQSVTAEDERLHREHGIDPHDFAADPLPMPALAESIRLTSIASSLVEQQTRLMREIQDINFELRIRDDPALVAKLGPGRD